MANNQVTSNTLSTATSTDNNGSAVFGIGADATNVKNVAKGRTNQTVFASTVIDGAQTDKALSGGTFAFDNDRGVIRRATTTVANGQAAPADLQSGSASVGNRRKFHSNETNKYSNIGSGIRAGNYNITTGKFDPVLVATSDDFHAADGGGTIDQAVADSRSRPGQLVYRDGSGTPVRDDYSAKNG
tara:strand:+ start:65 stop:622 length:558 start_codon:yes stop_codon:yes gene_type:complete